MDYVDRVYKGSLPNYSSFEKKQIASAEFVKKQAELLNESDKTKMKDGQLNIIRDIFEHILACGEHAISVKQRYRIVTIEKCTDMIQSISESVNIHPKDKIGLCNLFAEVQRMCMKYE